MFGKNLSNVVGTTDIRQYLSGYKFFSNDYNTTFFNLEGLKFVHVNSH